MWSPIQADFRLITIALNTNQLQIWIIKQQLCASYATCVYSQGVLIMHWSSINFKAVNTDWQLEHNAKLTSNLRNDNWLICQRKLRELHRFVLTSLIWRGPEMMSRTTVKIKSLMCKLLTYQFNASEMWHLYNPLMQIKARKHSSRMRIDCLRWPYLLQWPPFVSMGVGWGGVGGPEVNKFEQVSSDGH